MCETVGGQNEIISLLVAIFHRLEPASQVQSQKLYPVCGQKPEIVMPAEPEVELILSTALIINTID